MARVRDLWRNADGSHTPRHGHGKRWLAVWTEPGGREHTKAFSGKADAALHASVQETDASRGLYVSPAKQRTTVAGWCEQWLAGYGGRPSTRVKARGDLAKITAEFGQLPLAAVKPSHVKQWLARLAREGLSQSYIYGLHSRLSQVLGDAVHDGLLARSPCSRRTSTKQGPQRPYLATTAQVWALHDAMPERIRAAVLLGAFAGLRIAEACGLRTGDIDYIGRTIYVRQQYPALELKTDASHAALPVAGSMMLALSSHAERFPGQWVLTTGDGGQVGPWTLARAIRAHRAEAGLPEAFRFHDLRHYLASLLIASGADVKTVQARLRHASAKTTLDAYSHLWPDRDESTRAAIEAVFQAQTEQGRNRVKIV